jgi:uncharacterized repeat protein (TIGR02543 family)
MQSAATFTRASLNQSFNPSHFTSMNLRQSLQLSAVIATAWGLPIPAAHATIVSADSTDTLVETRWVQADSSNVLIDTRTYVYLTVNATHGTVLPPERQFAPNTTVELTPAPDLGYVFSKWTGDATGTANPLSLLLDVDKTLTAVFSQDPRDPDADGLTNYQELITYLTNPDVPDTDADGFTDGYEVAQGFSPTSDTSSPDTRMVAYTAVEIRFGAGVGKTYRIESSGDLQTWTPVETGIPGTGTVVTRFYTTQVIPKRYFRAVRE